MSGHPLVCIVPVVDGMLSAIAPAIDAMLSADREALVSKNEVLDSLSDRALDVSVSHERILLAAITASEPSKPVGFLDLVLHTPSPHAATIGAIVVDRAFRRRQIASALVRHAEAEARARDIEHVFAGVRRKNTIAQDFFGELGFAPESDRSNAVLLFRSKNLLMNAKHQAEHAPHRFL